MCRIEIECAFGMLVKKWLILSRGIEMELPEVVTIIEACVLLHNFTHHEGEYIYIVHSVSRLQLVC